MMAIDELGHRADERDLRAQRQLDRRPAHEQAANRAELA